MLDNLRANIAVRVMLLACWIHPFAVNAKCIQVANLRHYVANAPRRTIPMVNGDDIYRRPTYSDLMEGEGAHIRLRLETRDPIALSDFVANFVGLGNQFEKFISREYPDMKADSEFFVKEVRAGSIVADLIAWVTDNPLLTAGGGGVAASAAAVKAIDYIDKAQILTKFVNDTGQRIGAYFRPGGRVKDAGKGDLSDFYKTIASIAHDPAGSAQIEAASFEDGVRNVRASFNFRTAEARQAEQQIADHRMELDAVTDADHKRVLMRFVRPSIEQTKTHRRTGERAMIEAIHPKALAIVYASDLARERIAHEMKEAEANVFRLLFDVDVNVELSGGKPIAYRIMAVHDITDIPDDED